MGPLILVGLIGHRRRFSARERGGKKATAQCTHTRSSVGVGPNSGDELDLLLTRVYHCCVPESRAALTLEADGTEAPLLPTP